MYECKCPSVCLVNVRFSSILNLVMMSMIIVLVNLNDVRLQIVVVCGRGRGFRKVP